MNNTFLCFKFAVRSNKIGTAPSFNNSLFAKQAYIVKASKQSMMKYAVHTVRSEWNYQGWWSKINLGECAERHTLYKDSNMFGKRPPQLATNWKSIFFWCFEVLISTSYFFLTTSPWLSSMILQYWRLQCMRPCILVLNSVFLELNTLFFKVEILFFYVWAFHFISYEVAWCFSSGVWLV